MNEKFNSQVCTTKEQSQRLLDLGLKPETADMHYMAKTHWGDNWFIPTNERWYCLGLGYQDELRHRYNGTVEVIPAWSLHRLICLYGQDYTIKELYNGSEECYGMLITAIQIAIENDEFNKEYLKQ